MTSWRASVSRLFKLHGRRLEAYVRRRVRDRETASEIVQDVFTRVLAAGTSGSEEGDRRILFAAAECSHRPQPDGRTTQQRPLRRAARAIDLRTRVAADLTADEKTGLSYYIVRVAVPAQEIARLGKLPLLPGMPAEAFIQTGERTVFSYLVKPLNDQIARAFREE